MDVVHRSRVPRRAAPVPPSRALWVVLAAALASAILVSPERVESGPVLCPFRLITGLPCPACGLTRSWVHLAHGDPGQAVVDHPAGPLLLVLAVVTLGWMVRTRRRVGYRPWLRRAGAGALSVTVLVGAVRLLLALG